MSNNFCKMGVLKKKIWKFVTLSFTCTCKNSTVKIWGCCMQLHAQEPHFLNFLYNWLWNFSSCQLKVFLHMLASDFPHIFCCLQIACSFPGNYSLENCRQICGKSKAGTACKDMQWQALKLTFFATWSISRKCMGMAPKCVIRILCWAALADNVYFVRTAVLLKLCDITFSYKYCNFSGAYPLIKMAFKTVTKSIPALWHCFLTTLFNFRLI